MHDEMGRVRRLSFTEESNRGFLPCGSRALPWTDQRSIGAKVLG